MKRYSDDELLYLMRCGSQEAQRCLYLQYFDYISKWVFVFYRRTFKRTDYDDLVQISMIHFMRIMDNYRDDQQTTLRTFMKMAITRRLWSHTRVGKDMRIYQENVIVSLDDYVGADKQMRYDEVIGDPSWEHRPEKRYMIKDTTIYYMDQIQDFVSPKELRVMAYKNEGYDEKEIAMKLDISIKSVYNAVYRYHKKALAIDDFKEM